jgi:hypothetical protein
MFGALAASPVLEGGRKAMDTKVPWICYWVSALYFFCPFSFLLLSFSYWVIVIKNSQNFTYTWDK